MIADGGLEAVGVTIVNVSAIDSEVVMEDLLSHFGRDAEKISFDCHDSGMG